MSRKATAVNPNPFATGSRGLHLLSTPKLRRHLLRYHAFRDRLAADRSAWPPPENARRHVADVILEIEAELAAREGEVAA